MVEPEPINWAQGWRESIPTLTLVGTRPTGEPSVSVGYAAPRCWARPSRQLTREEHELWQLGQFCQDLYVGTGYWLPVHGAVKGEAPDFTLPQTGRGRPPINLELAAFTPTARRRQEPGIRRLREAVEDAGDLYAHLGGCHVTLSIDQGVTLGRIVSRQKTAILEALRDADRPPTLLDEFGLPVGLKTLGTGAGWQLTAYEMVPLDQVEWHDLAAPLLTVSAAIETTLREVADDLISIITAHDYGGVDWLVVPIVSPDREGLAFFEDEALIHDLLSRVDDVGLDLSAIRCRVLLHSWVDGRIVQLTPERTEVCEGRPEQQRRLTVITYNQLGDMFCAPLATPAVRLVGHR